MPNWKLHLGFGFVLTCFLVVVFLISGSAKIYTPSILALLLGVFASILGSDMPDFDTRRSRIKYILGFLMGGYVAFLYLIKATVEKGFPDVLKDLGTFTSTHILLAFAVFVGIIVINTILWFLPIRHRGRAHTVGAALIYGCFWGALSFGLFLLPPLDMVVVMTMAFAGYFAHLLLDGELKFWKS